MRRVVFFFVVTILSLSFFLLNRSKAVPEKTPSRLEKTVKRNEKIIVPSEMEAFLFVPYWSLKPDNILRLPDITEKEKLNTIIYFGIAANESGINTQEAGYNNLETFRAVTADFQQNTLLSLRLTDEHLNEKILSSQDLQDSAISQTLEISRKYSFDGVVVDLEHSVLPTQETVTSITNFLSRFATHAHQQNQSFAVTIYGDTLYRQRPYDLKAIGEFSDVILVMSYDFHKSYGEPGPNFPLYQGKSYPYSLEKMLKSFSSQIDPSKMVILFGLYGYDWAVDDQNRPLTSAKALTFNQIKAKFIESCPASKCIADRDETSGESHISYSESSGQKHVLWYEDPSSISTKIKEVQSFGIDKIGYWAYGYY